MALRALIIANGEFADARIPPLKSPVTDAQRLQALLSRDDVGPYEIELCANLSSYVLRQTVERFFNDAEFDDRQLLFFSGHGFKHGTDGRLYFGTKDTAKEHLRSTSLAARFVFEEASASIAQQTIIFIDSCYSGAFVKGQTLKASDHVIARDDFDVDGAHGIAVITASSSVQTASEIEVGDYVQSVFTRHLIEGIETGQADPAQTGRINLHDLIRYVRTNMRKDAPNQEPKPHFFGLDGSVEVARNPVKPVEVVPELVLPKRLLKKIASATFTTRRSACAELYHHADGNADAVDLVRVELEHLTRDPHDYVKAEARHQLLRLEQRFSLKEPAGRVSGDALAQPVPADSQSKEPAPPPLRPTPNLGPVPAKLPTSDQVTKPRGAAPSPPDTPPVQKEQQSAAAGPATPAPPRTPNSTGPRRTAATPKRASSWRRYLWLSFGSLVALLVFFWAMGQPPTSDESATTANIKLDEAVARPLPGEWLIGRWAVIGAPAGGCNRPFEIQRGSTANELVFTNHNTFNAAPPRPDVDSFRLDNDGLLITSSARYRRNADGRVSILEIEGDGTLSELSKCAD